jgi:hypothetical protein
LKVVKTRQNFHSCLIFLEYEHDIYFYLKIGFGGSCAFAFPPRQLAYAYVCNQLDPTALTIDLRSVRVIQAIDQILESFGNQNKNTKEIC